jgi:hypothetical protein
MQATWAPHEKLGRLSAKADLPDTVFAFPKQRKLPLTNASYIRIALTRLAHVADVTDEDRVLAFANIKKAAKHYDVQLSERVWGDHGPPLPFPS